MTEPLKEKPLTWVHKNFEYPYSKKKAFQSGHVYECETCQRLHSSKYTQCRECRGFSRHKNQCEKKIK